MPGTAVLNLVCLFVCLYYAHGMATIGSRNQALRAVHTKHPFSRFSKFRFRQARLMKLRPFSFSPLSCLPMVDLEASDSPIELGCFAPCAHHVAPSAPASLDPCGLVQYMVSSADVTNMIVPCVCVANVW